MVTAPFRVVLDANVLFPHVDSKKAEGFYNANDVAERPPEETCSGYLIFFFFFLILRCLEAFASRGR